MTGAGGLFKTGSGLLQITGTNSYAGATTVNNGTLQLAPPSISGFGGNGAGWTFNTTGSNTGVSGNVVTLTSTAQGSVSSGLWYNVPVPVTSPWTATFTMTDVFGGGADGGAFVLQTAGTGALGGNGGNKGFGGLANPNAGMVWELFNSSQTTFFTNGGTSTITGGSTGTVNLRAANTPTTFALSYDGAGNMTETLTQGANTFGPITYSPSNLSTILGNPAGGLAYIGLTGGDGSTRVTQTVGSFSFTSSAAATNLLPVNTPLTVNASGTFDLNGGNQAVGSLNGAGLVTSSFAGGTALLTLGNDGSNQTFSGIISGPLALTKVGNGLQTLFGPDLVHRSHDDQWRRVVLHHAGAQQPDPDKLRRRSGRRGRISERQCVAEQRRHQHVISRRDPAGARLHGHRR